MTIADTQSTQAEELSQEREGILENVAGRKWTKGVLGRHLDSLYLMGMRHGLESAILKVRREEPELPCP